MTKKAATTEKETNKLKGTVNTIETDVNELKKYTFLIEALLVVQTRSIPENLVVTSIKENEGEDSECGE